MLQTSRGVKVLGLSGTQFFVEKYRHESGHSYYYIMIAFGSRIEWQIAHETHTGLLKRANTFTPLKMCQKLYSL
jgi:hypothetical protein